MAGSLQDQLLKAGLSDPGQAKKLEKEKRKARRAAQRSKEAPVDEARAAAEQALAEKAARDRELNRQRDAAAAERAIEAQIVQLIEGNRLSRQGGDVGFNFSCGRAIKKLYVTAAQQRQLAAGAIAIARLDDRFELVPAPVAQKIAERDAGRVIFCTERGADELSAEEQDWYRDYEIPDDLMW